MTDHLVQFSTGIGSAEVARRVYEARQPGDRVFLITADTKVEDADNWRFAREVAATLPEAIWEVLCDGRTPMEVGRDRKCVPSNRMAVCSQILKRELIRKYLDEQFDPADSIVYLGYDWTEDHRMESALKPWRPWTVQCPLMAPPYTQKADLLDESRARGIEPPRLYATGAPHANCGGACVRAGQVEWRRLLFHNRDRYIEWEKEEQVTRVFLGKDVAILKHRSGPDNGKALTLESFRERLEQNDAMFARDDFGACGCDPWADPS